MDSFLQSLTADRMPLVHVAVLVLFLGLAIRYRKARDKGRQNWVPARASSDRLARVAAAVQPTKPVTETDRAFVSKVLTDMVAQVRHEADLTPAGAGK